MEVMQLVAAFPSDCGERRNAFAERSALSLPTVPDQQVRPMSRPDPLRALMIAVSHTASGIDSRAAGPGSIAAPCRPGQDFDVRGSHRLPLARVSTAIGSLHDLDEREITPLGA
jgi:hypothetical protein